MHSSASRSFRVLSPYLYDPSPMVLLYPFHTMSCLAKAPLTPRTVSSFVHGGPDPFSSPHHLIS
jgi:hypothetical protein